jgi:hypothetical protein
MQAKAKNNQVGRSHAHLRVAPVGISAISFALSFERTGNVPRQIAAHHPEPVMK